MVLTIYGNPQDHEQRASEAMQKIAASMEKASMAG